MDHRHPRSFRLIWPTVLLVVIGVLVPSVPAAAAGVTGPTAPRGQTSAASHVRNPGEPSKADGTLDGLIEAVKQAPKTEFTPKSARSQVLKAAKLAERNVDKLQACLALADLGTLRQALTGAAGTPPRVQQTLANALLADALSVSSDLLGSGLASACGGASVAANSGPAPVAQLVSSDTQHVDLHITFSLPAFGPQQGNGGSYSEMTAPGESDGGSAALGMPEIPAASSTLAVPLGATPSVQVLGTTGYQLPAVQLWPTQPSGVAATTGGGPLPPPLPPFEINTDAYLSSAPFPRQQAALGQAQSERGLAIADLRVAGGSYVPLTKQLTVYTSEDVQVTFGGNNQGSFGTTDLTDPWNLAFENIYQATIANWSTVKSNVSGSVARALCGEEMMVITSSALLSAAQQFAADRTNHGVLSNVFVTDGAGGIGTTPTAIRNAIAGQFNASCKPRPSYVTLIGDTSQVPTFELSFGLDGQGNPRFYEDPVATDQPYGYIHQAASIDAGDYSDLNPDLLVGRIPAGDVTTATNEVTTINQYEDAPPHNASYYGHVTGAEFFQACPAIQADCKDSMGNVLQPSTQDLTSFMRSSEMVGTEATVAGKTFVRVANDEQAYDSAVTITPQTFDNGTALPGGINWNGSTSDIQNAVNGGSFLLWHADHGYTNGSGWYLPSFGEGSLSGFGAARTNGILPVIWSSDCDSGKFDNPTGYPFVSGGVSPSFSEAGLELGDAVGTIGSSRESSIYWDGIMLEGMGTSLFPEEGNLFRALFDLPLVNPVRELGALLSSAKSYTMGYADMSTDIGAQGTVLEYNLFGDPSMPMLRDEPTPIAVANLHGVLIDASDVSVRSSQAATNGAVVTLLQNGRYIGRGIVVNGTTDITTPTPLTGTTGLQVIVSGDTYTPVLTDPFPTG
jgi:hypothetical protein